MILPVNHSIAWVEGHGESVFAIYSTNCQLWEDVQRKLIVALQASTEIYTMGSVSILDPISFTARALLTHSRLVSDVTCRIEMEDNGHIIIIICAIELGDVEQTLAS